MKLVGAVDQGTSSSRFILFDMDSATIVGSHNVLLPQIQPREGWVEHDPEVIFEHVLECIERAVEKAGVKASDVLSIGVTNQRETTVVWDRETGRALHNAIVWLDTRTSDIVESLTKHSSGGKYHLYPLCGLPLATYFSAVKLRWLFDNVPEVREAARLNRLAFGTIDSWLIYRLSGRQVHVTDVSNASRTMLMNLTTCVWDRSLCDFFGLPMGMLPEICSSAQVYSQVASGCLKGIPISGCIGDQQAALLGQLCVTPGASKCTYGTGCFLARITGTAGPELGAHRHGLLATVAFQLGSSARPVFALEGSVAIAGAAVRWLKDNLGLIAESSEVERLAKEVEDSAGVFFVPAFSGLFAPYWRDDARGIIAGLSYYCDRRHICRAVLEAVSFQCCEIFEAMAECCGDTVEHHGDAVLKVDGGMTVNDTLMQIQANALGKTVARPHMTESTSLGAAIASAIGSGVFSGADEAVGVLGRHLGRDEFEATETGEDGRQRRMRWWRMAVQRSMGWAAPEPPALSLGSDVSVPVRSSLSFALPFLLGVSLTLSVFLLRSSR